MINKRLWILLFFFWIVFFVGESVYAGGDCKMFSTNTDGIAVPELASEILGNHQGSFVFYPEQNVLVALQHLHYYCCEKGEIEEENCVWLSFNDMYYAQSFYLFDHLIEIGWRSLDGDANQQYPNATLSPHGVEWFQIMRKMAIAVHGAIPWVVIAYYEKFRKPEQWTFAMYIEEPRKTIKNSNFVKWFTKKYDEEDWFGLKNKYLGMCFIVQVMSTELRWETQTSNRNNKKVINSCLERANDRIKAEFDYVKQILIQQWANLVVSSLKNYADAYFVRGRMQELLQKFGDLQWLFVTVNQKFNEGTKQCVSK